MTVFTVAALAAAFREVAAGIGAWAARGRGGAGATPAVLDGPGLRARLEELRGLVEGSETQAIELCEATLREAPAALGPPLESLREALLDYDFDAALGRFEAVVAAARGMGRK